MREAIYLFGNLISKGTATELMKSCIDLYWGVLRLDCLRPCGIACFGASVQSSSRTEMISTLHNSNEGCFSRFQSFSRAVVPQISPDGECLSLPQKNRSPLLLCEAIMNLNKFYGFMAEWLTNNENHEFGGQVGPVSGDLDARGCDVGHQQKSCPPSSRYPLVN